MNRHETGRSKEGGMQNDSERMESGLRKGIRAFFDVDDITITFWGSAWSGLEEVRIEDRVVSRKRSLRFRTRHRFEHAGIRYEIEFRVVSMLRGQMEIELYRNGELIDSDRVQQNKLGLNPETGRFSLWRAAWQIAPFFLVGMLAGAGAAFLVDLLAGG
ncbi:MAG: hypothetical protein GVY32_11240 [Gammaproteobacteria bacterium]|jgi:hypothetical protein|nr:hypothetical protein [Gammaproteobacteria bacterium]